MRSFGYVSNGHMMSCFATTTLLSYAPLFRSDDPHDCVFLVFLAHAPHVQVAIHAVPRRDDFFTRLAEGGDVEKLDMELAKWLAALDALIIRLSAFLEEGNYGRV